MLKLAAFSTLKPQFKRALPEFNWEKSKFDLSQLFNWIKVILTPFSKLKLSLSRRCILVSADSPLVGLINNHLHSLNSTHDFHRYFLVYKSEEKFLFCVLSHQEFHFLSSANQGASFKELEMRFGFKFLEKTALKFSHSGYCSVSI